MSFLTFHSSYYFLSPPMIIYSHFLIYQLSIASPARQKSRSRHEYWLHDASPPPAILPCSRSVKYKYLLIIGLIHVSRNWWFQVCTFQLQSWLHLYRFTTTFLDEAIAYISPYASYLIIMHFHFSFDDIYLARACFTILSSCRLRFVSRCRILQFRGR